MSLPLTRLVLACALLDAKVSRAALLRACRPSDTPLVCRLESILTFLDVVALLLAFLLIVAIFAAVRTYRRKKQKLQPEEITQDAL